MLPDGSAKEQVLTIKKGDIIPVHMGAVSWWYNAAAETTTDGDGDGDEDVEILFLGETSKTHTPTQFDYFFLTGAMGVLQGFSADFITQALGLTENDSENLVRKPNPFCIMIFRISVYHEFKM